MNVKRPAVAKDVAQARELGDLNDNAEYQAAREMQSQIEARISSMEATLARAEIGDVTTGSAAPARPPP
ncbi:hypothetical protein ACFYMW_34400 [Streptomyces sp. NPDC006692]|uniref:hypothetical protein n=1 Tax=unclassified Streptomyces TaxID=2593676 RepID=UPI0036B6FB31